MTDFERDARLRKARVIAATCRDHGWSGADIVGLNATERAWLCEVAKVNVASPATWAVVIGLLGADEPPRGAQGVWYTLEEQAQQTGIVEMDA